MPGGTERFLDAVDKVPFANHSISEAVFLLSDGTVRMLDSMLSHTSGDILVALSVIAQLPPTGYCQKGEMS